MNAPVKPAPLDRTNGTKTKLANGGYAFGTWITYGRNLEVVKQIADAGFDHVYVDMEGTNLSIETVGDICQMARALGLAPIVRPPELTEAITFRLMTLGVMGLMFHDVDDLAEAQEIRRWITGEKGLSNHHSVSASAPQNFAFVVQIETVKGLANVEEILSVPGIDMVQFGSSDYSMSLGLTGQRSHPDVVKAERKTIETALKMGKHPRVELADISGAKPYLEMGVKHFCIGWDVRILYNWWRTNGVGMRAMLTGEAAVARAPQSVKTGSY